MTRNETMVSFAEWLEFLIFNRFTFTKIAVGLVLLVMIPARLAMVFQGTSAEPLFTVTAIGLTVIFFSVLYYRYRLDLRNPPPYMKQIKEDRKDADNQ